MWFYYSNKNIKCSRKNFKLLFCAGIALAIGDSKLHISSNENDWCHSARVTSPRQHNHFLLSLLASPLASTRTKPANMTEQTLFPLPCLLAVGQSQPTRQSTHSLSSLPSSRKDQPTWEITCTLLHWLFFTDCPSNILSSPLSTMGRPHPIYGPLVSRKSFFHHSSFLLNQWILGETDWIFSTPAFNFSILIPFLTTTSQLLLWHLVS